MAKVQMKMPEDFLMKVSRLADKTDEIIPKVLEAGAEVVEDKVRSNLQSVIGSGTTAECHPEPWPIPPGRARCLWKALGQ